MPSCERLAGDFQRVAEWEVPCGEEREAIISAAGSTGEASGQALARDGERVAEREALLGGTIEVEAGDCGSSAGGDQREAVGKALLGRCRDVVGGAAGSSVGRHRRRHLGLVEVVNGVVGWLWWYGKLCCYNA
jgi:hypothetical protein